MKNIAIVIVIALAFSGCTAFNNMVKNDALISQLAVEAATARVIHEHPKWKASVVRITDNAIATIDGKVVSDLASIESYVSEQINWARLLPEEQAIVNTLIAHVRINLEDSFRANGVVKPDEQMVQVRQVLQWVSAAVKRQ
jgi:hypothetical protein